MKAAFFHDAPLICAEDGRVYSIGFTYDIWARYLSVFDKLVVSTRMRACDDTEELGQLGLSSGPDVVFSPITSYATKYAQLFNRRAIVKEVRDALSTVDCAIIRLPSLIGQIACEECARAGKPYLAEVVGCVWDSLWNYSWQGKLLAPSRYYTTRKCVMDAKHVIYVTNRFLQKKYPTRGHSTSCSNVELFNLEGITLKSRLEKIQKLDRDCKIVIGTTAAVNMKYKGQQYVIQALGKLKKQGMANYEYQLVGSGDQSYLRSIANKYDVAEQVKFLGMMTHQEIFAWLDKIDVYVQPSRTEGLPRALIEAMSRGLPCFGSRVGGIPELLEEGYLISNTRRIADEISGLLKTLTISAMEEQARRNFDESRKYDKAVLDDRRKEFLQKFVDLISDK